MHNADIQVDIRKLVESMPGIGKISILMASARSNEQIQSKS